PPPPPPFPYTTLFRSHAVELAWVAAALAEAADRFERGAIEDPHLLVVAVGDVEQALIGRQRDVPHRSVAGRRLRDERLLHELARSEEHTSELQSLAYL